MNKVNSIPAKLEQLLSNPVFLLNLDRLDEKKRTQLIKVFESFYNSPKTMMEVEVDSGIMRSNVCYYVSDLRKSRLIQNLGKRVCTITKHQATAYTTNPALFIPITQASIFEGINP